MKIKSKRIANVLKYGYAVVLSKSVSVTPQRHCGFIVPKFCLASQAVQKISASISAMQTRLYSLYEGMTRQNKPVMVNMSGGSYRPRVNPLTIISQIMANLKTQNCKEAIMPKNIHQITRQRIQSADFAQKQGLVKRIFSMLKKVWRV